MRRLAPLLALALALPGTGCFFKGPPPPRSAHSVESLPAPTATSDSGTTTAAQVPPSDVTRGAAGRRGGAAPRGVVVRGGVMQDAGMVGSGKVPAGVVPPDLGGTYRYNARFEPPRGRILHGMGQFTDGNEEYLNMLGDPSIEPASYLIFVPLGDWPRSWESVMGNLREYVQREKSAGRIPHVDISLFGIDPATRLEASMDDELVATDRYDERVRDLAVMLRDLRGPVFVRIGGEFSGDWSDYHPYIYPQAFRKVVGIFREEGVDNAAFVWCYEPTAPDDFDVQDARGARWYPGDDVVDWFGLDVFTPDQFVLPPASDARAMQSSRAVRAKRFLQMAREHGKPVIIAECSAVKEGITSDPEDGRSDWESWFVPFLDFLESHPEVLAIHYINYDWRQSTSSSANGWLEARMSLNPYISEQWTAELRKPKYLHAPEVHLLNGYAEASAPLPGTTLPQTPREARRAAAEASGSGGR